MATETLDKICGHCIHYIHGDDPGCKKDVKRFGYLRRMKCFQLEEEQKFLPVKKDTSKFIEKDGVLMKVCLKCEELKPLTEFAANPTSADGYQCLCHKCFYEKYHKNKKRRKK